MPLDDREQKILAEIEAHFYTEDPEFAREVQSTSLFRHLGRFVRWAGLGMFAGVLLMVLTFERSTLVAALGFLLLVACGWVMFSNLKKMGRAGIDSVKVRAPRGLADWRARLRERWRREDD